MSVLSEVECYELLASAVVGRVGFQADGLQMILPVNFATDGQSVVIRVEVGGTLALNAPMAQIAFEVDAFDEKSRTGWSVLMHGTAHDATDSIDDTAEHLRSLVVSPWATGEKAYWLRLTPRSISGRRVP